MTDHVQDPFGSVQRWGHRHHHHDHGPRAAATGHERSGRPLGAALGVSRVHSQFRVSRHLLEQPPSPVAREHPHHRWGPVGEPSSAVLAVDRPVRHGLDGTLCLRADSDRRLRAGVADGCGRVHDPAEPVDRHARSRLEAGARRGARGPSGSRWPATSWRFRSRSSGRSSPTACTSWLP